MKSFVRILYIVLLIGCNAQDKKSETAQGQDKVSPTPKEHSEVKKEYDEFGNLIQYDSLYRWSYSAANGDSIQVNLDSIMENFKRQFKETAPFDWSDDFLYFPKPDSLFLNDFFREDYFHDQWQRQHFDLENIMKKMDSTRNAFLEKFHPGLLGSSKDSIKN